MLRKAYLIGYLPEKRNASLPARYRWKNRHRQNLGKQVYLSIKFEVGRLYE
ncbi:Uncharacterised protein [Escherichia coli]|uniref:Uncharacterized protein n=1 Tax=Escherichia coli TaxID=562 RepID=A0A377DH45_ECOLX|nr:Uncharacterised protein [Escherichia coli]